MSYCYFIQAGVGRMPVKIGVCNDLQKRIVALQCGCPYDLHLVFAIKCASRKLAEAMEKDFHKYFRRWHMRGEWFRYPVIKRAHNMPWMDLSGMEVVTKM